MLNQEQIQSELLNVYPDYMVKPGHCQLLADELDKVKVGYDDFIMALKAHNNTKQGDRVPTWYMLKQHITPDNRQPVDQLFLWLISQFGWSLAIKKVYSGRSGLDYKVNERLRKHLEEKRINSDSAEYDGLSDFWMVNFGYLIGGLDPMAAFRHMRDHGDTEELREIGKLKHEIYSEMNDEEREYYFKCNYHFYRQAKSPYKDTKSEIPALENMLKKIGGQIRAAAN